MTQVLQPKNVLNIIFVELISPTNSKVSLSVKLSIDIFVNTDFLKSKKRVTLEFHILIDTLSPSPFFIVFIF